MKRNTEDLIIRYFSDEPIEKVETIFNVVKGILKRRQPKAKKVTKKTIPAQQGLDNGSLNV